MRRYLCVLGCAVTVGLASSCAPPHPETQLDGTFKPAAQALDKLKWYVDAYGGSSISMPLLVQPDDSFKFNLTQVNPDTFFNSAKNEISGRSAGAFQSAQISGGSLAVSGDLAATQQYLGALSAFQRSQGVALQQSQLFNQAAFLQYQAAVASAQSIQDPAKRSEAIATALVQLSHGLSSPAATAPTIPAAPDLPADPSVPNAASSLLPGFAAPQTLFAQGTPSVSGSTRQALLLAAGDTATNAILSLLGDQSKMTKFQGKRVLFGVSMVSVNPGWKTKQGYSADLQIHLGYKYAPARPSVRDAFLKKKIDPKKDSPVEQAALEQLQACVAASMQYPGPADVSAFPVNLGPFAGAQFAPYAYVPNRDLSGKLLIAAVSPMADAQSLDLQSATRVRADRALQIALALSYAGLKAQGALFSDFAKQAQKDVETRSENVVVNAYSSGDILGFRVHPTVEADPDHGGTARNLKPYSFPTLIVVGSDDEDLRPRVAVTMSGATPQCFLVEQQLEVFQSPQWIPDEDRCGYHVEKDCVGRVFTEEERFGVAAEVWNKLRYNMSATMNNAAARPHEQKLARFMLQRAELLSSMLDGTTYHVALPVEYLQPVASLPKPTADTTAPAEVTLEVDDGGAPKESKVVMLIAGSDLDQIDLAKVDVAAGKDLLSGTPTAKLAGKSILMTFAAKDQGAVVFKLPSKDGSTVLYSTPFVVHKPKDFVVTTTSDKTKTGVVSDSVRYSPGTPAGVVRSHIERDKQHYPNEHRKKGEVKVKLEAQGKSDGGG